MDPSQLQSDAENDSHSLENAETVVEQSATGQPASGQPTGSATPAAPQPVPTKGPSLLKRLWAKFNIYLLLFVLLLVIAAGITTVMIMRSRTADPGKTEITSQGLSEEALDQLANSGTTVGSPKQILNVASNAIFAGSVLLRSNLEVAGKVKIGGDLSLPGITISGNSQLGEVQANSLGVGGPATVTGVLTARNGLNVTGRSTFTELTTAQLTTGSLTLNGPLRLTNHITLGGPIPGISRGTALGGGGTASVSGSDSAGSIAISTGNAPPAGCFATVEFHTNFANTPHIIITPVGSAAASVNYYINRSTSSFSICTINAAPAGATFGFDYIAVE